MVEQLQAIGLNELQAKAYLYLLDYSAGRKPTQVAAELGVSRTNAYKILDSLDELGLVRRSETTKTLTYFAENPIALANFSAEARNHARAVEAQVKSSMLTLQKRYQKQIRHSEVQVTHGRAAILQAFGKQIRSGGEIHFIKSRADIPFMGFETMRALRKEPVKYGMRRYGITPDSLEIDHRPEADLRSGLTRTLIPQEDYQSPVEWAVSGNELAIINYTDQGSVIRIRDEAVAKSFLEIWRALDKNLRR